ncbi:MAG: hypothetical protein GWN33_06375, partial [Gammaproteobacteria bacterium]|nr:hypothetical protein [Gammaproteobacteria bacterium]
MSPFLKKHAFILLVLVFIAGMLLSACQVPEDAAPEPQMTPTSTAQEDVPQQVVPIAMV